MKNFDKNDPANSLFHETIVINHTPVKIYGTYFLEIATKKLSDKYEIVDFRFPVLDDIFINSTGNTQTATKFYMPDTPRFIVVLKVVEVSETSTKFITEVEELVDCVCVVTKKYTVKDIYGKDCAQKIKDSKILDRYDIVGFNPITAEGILHIDDYDFKVYKSINCQYYSGALPRFIVALKEKKAFELPKAEVKISYKAEEVYSCVDLEAFEKTWNENFGKFEFRYPRPKANDFIISPYDGKLCEWSKHRQRGAFWVLTSKSTKKD